jgi:predicted SprT family Zn-dependent metalloprotease
MLKIVAHEMIHIALEHNAKCDHDHHDENFIEMANQVCRDLKWDGGVL